METVHVLLELPTFKSSSQVPHQSFRAQTAALLTPAFGPLLQVKDDVYFQANEFFDEIIHLGTNVRPPAD